MPVPERVAVDPAPSLSVNRNQDIRGTASFKGEEYDLPHLRRSGWHLQQYDEVCDQIGMEKPDGAHVHIAWRTEWGFHVIEVWDSQDHIDRFMEAGLGKAMQAAEIPTPTITEFEVHKLDWIG